MNSIVKKTYSSEIDNLKKILRKKFKKIREVAHKNYNLENNNLLEEKLSKLIFENFPEKKEIILSSYHPINKELDCLLIAKNLKEKFETNHSINIRLCLPVTPENDKVLKFYEFLSHQELILGKYKILEPDKNKCREVIPHIILTPLLAFDRVKNRLGYGSGYYDNTFSHLKNSGFSFKSIGIAYDEQYLFDLLPIGEYDQALDYIFTPSYNI
jgi:5-formyltetrahydrofolate cyclo-ligase